MHATVAPLLAHLELIEAAKQQNTEEEIASDPAAAQFTQAARALSENRLEEALMTLLELARHAPTYRNDIGRRAMLALFGLLGKEDALTRQFRARLAELAI
jgi:putative thioredoxin